MSKIYIVTERNISTGCRIESFDIKHYVTKSSESALKLSYQCAKKYSDIRANCNIQKTNPTEELLYSNDGSYYFDYDEHYELWNYYIYVTEKNINDDDIMFTISTHAYA